MAKTKCFNKKNEEYFEEHPHSFVGYFTAGYPDTAQFFRCIREAEQCGMGIFEIGFPSDDPYADGEIIRKSHAVIDHQIRRDMDFWKKLRETVNNPIWVMGYKKEVIDTGIYRELAAAGVIDAIVIPDLGLEERLQIRNELEAYGVDTLGFVGDRMEWENNYVTCSTFPIIYQQLYAGPTGCVNNTDTYKRLFHDARERSDSRLLAGFGIGTAERAVKLLKDGFDGVIIGTAIMKKMNVSFEELMAFLREMEQAIEGVD